MESKEPAPEENGTCSVRCMRAQWKLDAHRSGQVLCSFDYTCRTPTVSVCPYKKEGK
jgi:hypothetical protein